MPLALSQEADPPLWLYWEGPMPPYIRLCADLWAAYYPGTALLGPNDIVSMGMPADVWEAIQRWHVAQRSDAIRCFLLRQYGGMWCDIDCIPMRSVDIFIDLAKRCPAGVAAYDSTDRTIGVGFIAAREGAEAIERWWNAILQVVRDGRSPRWLEVSTEPFTRIVADLGRENFLLWPLAHISPVPWNQTERFLEQGEEAKHREFMRGFPAAWCWMLCNHKLKDLRLWEWQRQKCLRSNTLLSAVFRESVRRLYEQPPPARGKALATLNVHGDGLPHNFRQSMRAAAERWGVEFVEITTPMVPWPDPYWEKLNLDRHLAMYEQVMYVDRDVVIRSDCPNLFELVPEETFAAVPSEQEGHSFRREIEDTMTPLLRLCGIDHMVWETEYLNSGVMVFSPRRHAKIFEIARALHPIPWVRNWITIDQGLLALALKIVEPPRVFLPPTFNRCGAMLWDHWQPQMTDYIWHFCGPKNWEHITHTIWQIA